MPKYSYQCKKCKSTFDELHLSFSGAEAAEKAGIVCTNCGSKRTARNTNPGESMKGSGFRKYGLHTYH